MYTFSTMKRKLNCLANEVKSGASGAREEGNSIPPLPKKRRCNEARRWVFTDFDVSGARIRAWRTNKLIKKLAMQIEVCPETKREHIQGCFELFAKSRPMSSLWKGPHYEIMRGKDTEAVTYCTKTDSRKDGEKSFIRGYAKPTAVWSYEMLRPAQQAIVDKYQEDEDPLLGRKIHWYWEESGGWGKSILAKYMVQNMNAIALQGANKDCLYAVAEHVKKEGGGPPIIIFDVPRVNHGAISYQALESIKNGMIFSTKYESSMVVFNSPHIIVLSNQEPEYDKLSPDRWVVTELRAHLFK